MNDAAILNALTERTKLLAKITESEARTRRLKTQLAEINGFISQWERFSGIPVPFSKDKETVTIGSDSSQNGTDSKSAVLRYQNSKKEEVAAAAKVLLREAIAPLSRTDLYQKLVGLGLRINGSNPEMVLSTMLWRAGYDQGIVRLKSGGYWLRDRDIPQNDSIDGSTSVDESPIE